MLTVYTPERAERLAKSFDETHMHVQWLPEPRIVIGYREYGTIVLATVLYARVWRGKQLYLQITYEKIDERSVIL